MAKINDTLPATNGGIMNKIIMGVALALAAHSAYAAGQANHGHHGSFGGQGGCNCQGAQASSAGVAGNAGQARGLAYFTPVESSLVDQYQPWPQSEMKQFQRP